MESPGQTAIEIRRAGVESVEELRPLWEELTRHHLEVASELEALGPARPMADAWAIRRASIVAWLERPDGFALIAEADGAAVGFALVHGRGPEAIWDSGDRVAELETLVVAPGHRGRGIGTQLMDRVYAELGRGGVEHLTVSVLAPNAEAIRFYERFGMRPMRASLFGPLSGSGGA